jgi:hypothetical protein
VRADAAQKAGGIVNSIRISCRRDSSFGFALELQVALRRHFAAQLCMDTDAPSTEAASASAADQALESRTVVLVVIGPRWLGAGESGARQIDDPHDAVRDQVRKALQARAILIPVLVGGASMPSAPELPTDVQPLAASKPRSLRANRWDADLADLLGFVHDALQSLEMAADEASEIDPVFNPLPPVGPGMYAFAWSAAVFGIVFAVLGAGMVIDEARFERDALPATARVSQLMEDRSKDGASTYYPVVDFVDARGQSHRATPRWHMSSSPPEYVPGEAVQILYDPIHPNGVAIDTFSGRWGMGSTFGRIGIIALIAPAIPAMFWWKYRRKWRRLLIVGRPIGTVLHSVRQKRVWVTFTSRVFYVQTEWQDPVSRGTVIFRSLPIWNALNEKTLPRGNITVVVNRDDVRDYLMDLSFLSRAKPPQYLSR